MKVLGVLGGPKKGGNTDILLEEVLRGSRSKGASVEKICLGDLDFKGCIDCGGCDKTGICILRDDMTPLYDRLKEADIVILASPIFFASVPSQLKAMIDRCQSEWVAKYILRKKTPRRPDAQMSRGKGAFICVSGHNKKTFFENAKKIAEVFFKTMDIDFTDELFFGGVNAPGDIKNIKGALQKAYRLGQRIGKG